MILLVHRVGECPWLFTCNVGCQHLAPDWTKLVMIVCRQRSAATFIVLDVNSGAALICLDFDGRHSLPPKHDGEWYLPSRREACIGILTVWRTTNTMDGLVLAGNTTTKSTNFGWTRYGCLSNTKLDRLGNLFGMLNRFSALHSSIANGKWLFKAFLFDGGHSVTYRTAVYCVFVSMML